VLFADDEELIRDLGRQVMEMHGYTVFLAEDGMRAIDLSGRTGRRSTWW